MTFFVGDKTWTDICRIKCNLIAKRDMFFGSFDISVWVAIIVLLVLFWKPVTSRILVWAFVIVTFPFALIWKGIEKMAGIDEASVGSSDYDKSELALKRKWLAKKGVLAAAGFLFLLALILWGFILFDIYDWKLVGILAFVALIATIVIAVKTKFFDPPEL